MSGHPQRVVLKRRAVGWVGGSGTFGSTDEIGPSLLAVTTAIRVR